MKALLVLLAIVGVEDKRLIPDPTYNLKVGDSVLLGIFNKEEGRTHSAAASITSVAYTAYWQAIDLEDDDALERLVASGQTVDLPPGTVARVEFLEKFSKDDVRADAALVSVLSGAAKGRAFWVPQLDILGKTPGESDVKAATLLKSAQNLEKAGKPSGALEHYRQILKEYPKSAEAKTAAERIKALTK